MKIKTRNLAKRIAREVSVDELGKRNITFMRSEAEENIEELRRPTREEIIELHSLFCEAIPDDFDFIISLGEDGFGGHLIYSDGLQTEAGIGFPFLLNDRIFENLRRVDWDDMRGQALPLTNSFDQMTDSVVGAAVNIKSTAKAQQDHFEAFTSFLKEAKQNNTKFAILAFDDCMNQIEYEECEGFSQVMHYLGDFMALSFQIVSLIVEGKALTVPEIEALKVDAAKSLGPISRAIAEGRMDGILAPN